MKDSKRYLNNLRRLFPIYGKNERQFIKGIENEIKGLDDYSYENIVEEIGEPTDIISTYYQEVDTQYLLKKLNYKKLIKLCCIIITVAILAASLWRVHILNKEYEDFHNSIPVEYEEVIGEVE